MASTTQCANIVRIWIQTVGHSASAFEKMPFLKESTGNNKGMINYPSWKKLNMPSQVTVG